ncbi:uncharacterized protein TRIADDRAFT_442, partial [Trichoplax adhaerens]
ASTHPSFPYHHVRLPNTIKPIHYHLYLQPDYQKLINQGNVTVSLHCHQKTDFILFHGRGLQINDIRIIDQSTGNELTVKRTLQDPRNDYYYVQVNSSLVTATNYTLVIQFSGLIYPNRLRGFYRSTYVTASGQKRYLYTTDFEPTDARMAFPCFDEPAMKASFELTVVVPPGYHALFNTLARNNHTLANQNTIIHFQKSVPMSTYLVAFVISDFQHLEKKSKDNILVRTWTHQEKVHETQLSLQVAADCVSYYGKIFNIKYPLPKLDLVGIPDFSSGGMENWGLITFNEVQFLYNLKYATSTNYFYIVETVAHEVAHQWFGDLVTMDWWSDVWLNEGFATFVSYLGMRNSKPGLQGYQQFSLRTMAKAIIDDSLPSSHPVYQPVNDPNQIGALFDHISYDKGASLLRMLYEYFGEQTFFKGVEDYLKAYAYGNAKSQNLWNAMSSVTGENINSVMNTWLLQMNYPLVTLKLEKDKISISQTRFLEDKNGQTLVNQTSPYRYKWLIPFCFETSDGYVNRTIIGMNGATLQLPSAPKWVKANCNQTGYFRVNYDAKTWQSLIEQIQSDHESLSIPNKANLLDDSFYLTKVGSLNPSIFLEISRYLANETNYVPFATSLPHLDYIISTVNDLSSQTIGKKYLKYLLQSNLRQLGWKDTGSNNKKLLRTEVLSTACFAGDRSTILNITNLYREWLYNNKSISANLKSVILRCGIAHGGNWNMLLQRYYASKDATERRILMSALASSTDKSTLKKLLNIIIDKSKVKAAEALKAMIYIAQNPAGTDLAWNFVVLRWNLFFERYGQDTFSMATLITQVIKPMKSEVQLDKVKLFFKCTPNVGTGQNAVPKAIDQLETKIAWRRKYEGAISTWF